MRYITITFTILIFCSCTGLSQSIGSNGYNENLQKTIKHLISGDKLTIEQIQDAIPKKEDDFFTFYSYTEKDEKSNAAFYRLNSLILKHAMDGENSILKPYLLLSEFVDGEYAESYFEDVEAVIEKNREVFCKLFPQLPKKKVSRLSDLYDKYCK
ncbi:MAG: hypothetical protein ACOC2E_07240 [Bacteroidota bacterium]